MNCQKCRQPIEVDNTIQDLNPASFDLLVASTSKAQKPTNSLSRSNYPQERRNLYDRVSAHLSSPVYKRTIPAPQDESTTTVPAAAGHGLSNGNPDMSFIEITQSQAVLPDKNMIRGQTKSPEEEDDDSRENGKKKRRRPKDKHAIARDLFAILSSHSDVDQPICAECTSILLASFNARLTSSNRERDAYNSFLKSVQQTISSQGNDQKGQQEKPNAQRANETAFDHLRRTEDESQKVEGEIGKLEEESQQADLEEQAYWTSRNAVNDKLHDSTVRLLSLQEKYTHDRQQLERLQRTNVYNDTFCIGHDGYFGVINGLRLGRLPNQNVDWGEINAAWGQTLLLLATVAERLKYTFQGYRLRPQGSTSRIEKLEYPQQSPSTARQSAGTQDRGLHSAAAHPEPKITVLDLFSSGDMPIGRLFNSRRFDNGMVAFLDCLGQLGKYVERTSSIDLNTKPTPTRSASSRNIQTKRALPYTTEDDKIGNVSIKLGIGFNQDENFTKACKYALTCCKYLLAYVSNLEAQKAD
ncbi:beclin 1 [Exophiala viscosa]|uniref:Beclin 1 n=1 Tax=Exophiala viscosa TaxID=2486360 RepID=A0AAN6E5X7_9EURO|nr:beclin 1 [Exophiala viscosa]